MRYIHQTILCRRFLKLIIFFFFLRTSDCKIFNTFHNISGGFVPKDPPDGTIYKPDKFRTTTAQMPVHSTIHHNEPIVRHPAMGSGELLIINY